MAVSRKPTVRTALTRARRATYQAELLAKENGDQDLADRIRTALTALEEIRIGRREEKLPGSSPGSCRAYL